MFQIEIVNFRCWRKKTFTFPDEGLILLTGVSGAGKSSLLNAIYFALYGVGTKIVTIGEKKCSVRLTFQGFDITRTKGPNRLFLTCVSENKDENTDNTENNGQVDISNNPQIIEYEDEVAQQIINKKFGTNFTITSYITQKMAQSFLSLGPNDKMNFLEQLSLGEENITDIKKKTKEKIKEKKEILLQKIGQLEVISREVGEMKRPEEVQFPLGDKHSDIKIKNESVYWKRTIKELQESEKAKRNIESEFSKEKIQRALREKQQGVVDTLSTKLEKLSSATVDYDGDDNLESMRETLDFLKNQREFTLTNDRYNEEKKNFDTLRNQEMDTLHQEREKLTNELEGIDIIDDDYLANIKRQIEIEKQYIDLTRELTTREKKLAEFKKDETHLKTELSDLETKLTDEQKQKSEFESRIDVKSCPCCKASLRVSKNVLVLSDFDPVDEEQAKVNMDIVSREIISIRKQIDTIKKDLVLIADITKKINDTRQKIIDLDNNTRGVGSEAYNIRGKKIKEESDITELQSLYDSSLESKSRREKLTKKIKGIEDSLSKEELSPTLKKLQLQLSARKKELDKIKSQMEESVETDYTEEELRQEISTQQLRKQESQTLARQIKEMTDQLSRARKELDRLVLSEKNYEQDLDDITDKMKALELKSKQHKTTHEAIQKYLEYKKQLEEYQKWEKKLNTCKEEETKSRKLLAMTETFFKKIQEAESIAISQTIDTINYYMNFYLDKFFPDNPITVEICPYKETKKDIKPTINIEVGYKGNTTDLNSLSGGEYDRVTLSIVLALNTIFGSNLLMLDESIVSLDSDLTNEILEVLKDHLKGKAVVVVAHQIGEGVFDNVISVEE